MAIKQDRPYTELIPPDLAELREALNVKLGKDGPLSEPGWYVGRIEESSIDEDAD